MPLGANKVALLGVAGVSTGTAVLLSTATASSSASISFTLPTAYKQVKFGFYNVTPATDDSAFQFQVNASGQTGYNETMTTTSFRAYHTEDNATAVLGYRTDIDQAQGTSYQALTGSVGNGSDESCAGELFLYNPASTTYVKHFVTRLNMYGGSNYSGDYFIAGYINNTAVISEIDFKFSSGNISTGTIKMWGIK